MVFLTTDERLYSRTESRDQGGRRITFGYDRKTQEQIEDNKRLETGFLAKRKNSLPLVNRTEGLVPLRAQTRTSQNKQTVKHLQKLSIRDI